MMRLALVHDWLTGMRGGEKCLEVLCRRFPDARLFTLVHARGSTSPAIERMRITTSFLQRLPGAARHYRYLLPLMPKAVASLAIPADVDLVVSLSHAVAKSVRPPRGVPHVCYCFTPMRYAWHRREDYFTASARFPQTTLSAVRNTLLDWMRDWDRDTAGRVSHFVAISRTVARRIAECYGRESRIIYPPVDVEFYTPSAPEDAERGAWIAELGCQSPHAPGPTLDPPLPTPHALLPTPYYLCVSALVPYKRIDLAIAACNRLGRRLVVLGDGPERGRLARLAGPTVRLAGWADNVAIREHLRTATALLFPANEDFGIVPLEAQACGCPVVAFGQGGATETVLAADPSRRGTGLFFEAQTPDSLAQAMLQLESHPDWFDPRLARRQAERFAAPRFERELVEYLEVVWSSACGRRL